MRSTAPLFFSKDIRAIEQAFGTNGLMEKAGLTIADFAETILADHQYRILILAGPGNNGGDAFVAARYLKLRWMQVTVVFTGDTKTLPADAAIAFNAWQHIDGETHTFIPAQEYDLVIDGLFGIGLNKPLNAEYTSLIQVVNQLKIPVIAIDIPSGLNADTGCIMGAAIQANFTLTFLGLKPGLLTNDGCDMAGQIQLETLGVINHQVVSAGALLNRAMFNPIYPFRKRNAHKGLFGEVGIIGGADGMLGAAILAGRSASLIGAGRVYLGLLAETSPALDSGHLELMITAADSLRTHSTSIIGPGLGQSNQAIQYLAEHLSNSKCCVLDADALQLIAQHHELKQLVIAHGQCVLTPHPGEASALLHCSTADIQQDRIKSALDIALSYNAITVLKGAGSIIATPTQQWFINPTGNSGMSSAGMGDVLSGIIGGLLAQGLTPLDAALLGVYLHGAAADSLVSDGIGPIGLTATEVSTEARKLLNDWMKP